MLKKQNDNMAILTENKRHFQCIKCISPFFRNRVSASKLLELCHCILTLNYNAVSNVCIFFYYFKCNSTTCSQVQFRPLFGVPLDLLRH